MWPNSALRFRAVWKGKQIKVITLSQAQLGNKRAKERKGASEEKSEQASELKPYFLKWSDQQLGELVGALRWALRWALGWALGWAASSILRSDADAEIRAELFPHFDDEKQRLNLIDLRAKFFDLLILIWIRSIFHKTSAHWIAISINCGHFHVLSRFIVSNKIISRNKTLKNVSNLINVLCLI